MSNYTVPPEALDVLSRSRTEGQMLYLPSEQLARPLYEKVNKALTHLGGKWNPKAKAHVFSSDAAVKLASIVGTGVAVDLKKKYQAFYTPESLAKRVAEKADVYGCRVLEPNIGGGALAIACRDAGATRIVGFDIDPEAVAASKALGFEVMEGDFLSAGATMGYERVVMNPPFNNDQDLKHVWWATRWLLPDGKLVAIMSDEQERPLFRKLLDSFKCEVEPLGRGAFKESGTDWPTLILTLNK